MVMEAPDLQQRDRRADTSIQRAWTYKGRIIVKMLTTTADDPTPSIRFAEFNPDTVAFELKPDTWSLLARLDLEDLPLNKLDARCARAVAERHKGR